MKRLFVIILSLICVFNVTQNVFAVQKNVREAGLVDHLDDFSLISEKSNTEINGGFLQSSGGEGFAIYRSYRSISFVNVYYTGKIESIKAFVSSDNKIYRELKLNFSEGYLVGKTIKPGNYFLKLQLSDGVKIDCVEINTKTIGGIISIEQPEETVKIPSAEEVAALFQKNGLSGIHPRIVGTKADFDRIIGNIDKEPYKKWIEGVLQDADSVMNVKCVEFQNVKGTEFLEPCREIKKRLQNLCMAYKITGDEKYASRAWEECKNAIDFPTLYPDHFLNVGETVFAYAITYDWLYDYLSEEQKSTIIQGMKKQAFEPGASKLLAGTGYAAETNNWNGVCIGGMATAAMAIFETDPQYYGELISASVRESQKGIEVLSPDGIYPEGPTYWNYGTIYLSFFLSSMDNVFGTDFGLSKIDGFDKTGGYPLYITSTIFKTFNYSDSGASAIAGPQAYWMAKKFNMPLYSWYQKKVGTKGGVFDLIWYDEKYYKTPDEMNVPMDEWKSGDENFAVFRGSWDDKEALYAAMKGGDNQSNHGDLDIGSFMLDALGERWLVDLGAEKYTNEGYWETGRNGKRWNYYGKRADAHNTLVINPSMAPDQDPYAKDEIVDFQSNGSNGFAILDMSGAYSANAKSVTRGLRVFDGKRQVVLQDEVVCTSPSDIWWQIHTEAEIELSQDAKSARLRQNGKELLITLAAPTEGKFIVRDCVPLKGTPSPATNISRAQYKILAIYLPKVKETVISTIFTPIWNNEYEQNRVVPQVKPIEEWELENEEFAVLDNLTVDGKTIDNFAPERYSYNIELPRGVNVLPEIKPISGDNTIKIEAQNDLFGAYRIYVSNANKDLLSTVYTINVTREELAQLPDNAVRYEIKAVSASAVPEPQNKPVNTIDGDLSTRWSAEGVQSITYDLGALCKPGAVKLAYYQGDSRVNSFRIEVSADDVHYKTVYEGESSGITAEPELYGFYNSEQARYVRIVGKGNSVNQWNSISEVEIYGGF